MQAIDEASLELEECDEYYPIADIEPTKPVEEVKCSKIVNLKGPNSPLEAQVHSLLLNNEQKSIMVDQHSVNSVFLTSMQQVKAR